MPRSLGTVNIPALASAPASPVTGDQYYDTGTKRRYIYNGTAWVTPDVLAGGTAGQVLTKVDGTDYNTQWQTISGGGGGFAVTDIADGSTSANTLVSPGIYRIQFTQLGLPSWSRWNTSNGIGFLAVYSFGSNITQMVESSIAPASGFPGGGELWMRSSGNTGSSWSDWQSINSANSNLISDFNLARGPGYYSLPGDNANGPGVPGNGMLFVDTDMSPKSAFWANTAQTWFCSAGGNAGQVWARAVTAGGVAGPWRRIDSAMLTGGSAGQVLSKVDGSDYNTQWATPATVPGFAAPTAETAFGTSSAAGSSTSVPRADHTHGNPANPLPTGGAAGQVLSKISSADYNTTWSTPLPAYRATVTSDMADQGTDPLFTRWPSQYGVILANSGGQYRLTAAASNQYTGLKTDFTNTPLVLDWLEAKVTADLAGTAPLFFFGIKDSTDGNRAGFTLSGTSVTPVDQTNYTDNHPQGTPVTITANTPVYLALAIGTDAVRYGEVNPNPANLYMYTSTDGLVWTRRYGNTAPTIAAACRIAFDVQNSGATSLFYISQINLVSVAPSTTSLDSGWHYLNAPGEPTCTYPPYDLAGNSYSPGRFRRDGAGCVWLDVMIVPPTASATAVLFTLPQGFRPAYSIFLCVSHTSGPAVIRVDPNGDVVFAYCVTGTLTWTHLGSATFMAEDAQTVNWVTPALGGSWTNLGTLGGKTCAPARYFVDAAGDIHLSGMIAGGGTGSANAPFSLPANLWPNGTDGAIINQPTCCSPGSAGAQARVDVNNGALGVVVVNSYGGGGGNAWVSLDGIVIANPNGNWSTPALINSWVAYSASYVTTQFCVNKFGIAAMRGLIKSGSGGAVAAASMSTEIAPRYTVIFLGYANAGCARLDTIYDGRITPSTYWNSGTNAFVSTVGRWWSEAEGGGSGPQGPTGPQGPSGGPVPSGGQTGFVLAKKSATDGDVQWANPVSDTGWKTLPIASGYAAYTNTPAPAYRIISGVVYFRGQVGKTDGTAFAATSFNPVTALPAEAQPTLASGGYVMAAIATSSGSITARLYIGYSNTAQMTTNMSATGAVYIDIGGFSYPLG